MAPDAWAVTSTQTNSDSEEQVGSLRGRVASSSFSSAGQRRELSPSRLPDWRSSVVHPLVLAAMLPTWLHSHLHLRRQGRLKPLVRRPHVEFVQLCQKVFYSQG